MTAFTWLAVVALAAWLWLALLRGWYWRPAYGVPDGPPPLRWPSVAVVVPARDEAAVLPASLPTLLAQRYAGPVRVILVDDGSTDGTAAVAARLTERTSHPFTVIDAGSRPAGWTGKVWAMQAGVAEAGAVELLLFTDADITHDPDSLSALVRAMPGRDLVSEMARLRTSNGWERLLVPAFVYFFALLYPFRWSNRPGARTAAAAGGCVLLRRDVLQRAGGLAKIRGAIIDDVALARLVKRAGGRTYLGLADRVASVRAYPRLGSLWSMVSRSAYSQLRYSPLLLAGTVLGLVLVFLVPPVATIVGAASGQIALTAIGGASWLLMTALYLPMLRYYRQPPWHALAMPMVGALYLGMTVASARSHYRGGAAWKGRSYPVAS